MARLPRDARLDTREARSRLAARHEPYWRQIHQGLFVGYRRDGTGAGTWYARKWLDRRYLKQRLGIADDLVDADDRLVLSFAQAVTRAMRFRDEKAPQEAAPITTVRDAFDEYLDWFTAHRKGGKEARQRAEAQILPTLGGRKLKTLTTGELRRWHQQLAEQPLSRRGAARDFDATDPEAVRRRRSTANRMLNLLRAALNHAWREGAICDPDTWRRIRPFRETEVPRVRYLSAPECHRLLEACDEHFRHLVRAGLATGCRYGELAALRCDDYNADARAVHVRYAKAGRGRHVPLTDEDAAFFAGLVGDREAGEKLLRQADGQPWGKSLQHRRMADACAVAAIAPAISFHVLRHTYASLLVMRGVPLQVVAQALGHSDTRMTEKHYAHLQPSYVADTIRAFLPSWTAPAAPAAPTEAPEPDAVTEEA